MKTLLIFFFTFCLFNSALFAQQNANGEATEDWINAIVDVPNWIKKLEAAIIAIEDINTKRKIDAELNYLCINFNELRIAKTQLNNKVEKAIENNQRISISNEVNTLDTTINKLTHKMYDISKLFADLGDSVVIKNTNTIILKIEKSFSVKSNNLEAMRKNIQNPTVDGLKKIVEERMEIIKQLDIIDKSITELRLKLK